MELVKRLIIGEDGADAVEYGLLATLIAVAIIVGAGLLGTSLNAMFTGLAGVIQGP